MPQPIGHVANTNGKTFAETGGELRTLAKGDPIYADDVLVTKAGSNLEVQFADDTVLSQGPDARMVVDDYAYDPDNAAGSNMLLEMAQGSFRMVTGKIAEANPGGVKVESPLATIGIRGTGTNHEIKPPWPSGEPGNELHGAERLTGGHSLIFQDTFGNSQVITFAGGAVDFSPTQPMGAVRPFTPQELAFFQAAAPLVTFGDPPPPPPPDDDGTPGNEGEGPGPNGEGDGPDGEDPGPDGEGGWTGRRTRGIRRAGRI